MNKFENMAILNLSQLAEYLQISKQTIYLWIKKGALPYFRIGGTGQYRFVKSKIDKLIKKTT